MNRATCRRIERLERRIAPQDTPAMQARLQREYTPTQTARYMAAMAAEVAGWTDAVRERAAQFYAEALHE